MKTRSREATAADDFHKRRRNGPALHRRNCRSRSGDTSAMIWRPITTLACLFFGAHIKYYPLSGRRLYNGTWICVRGMHESYQLYLHWETAIEMDANDPFQIIAMHSGISALVCLVAARFLSLFFFFFQLCETRIPHFAAKRNADKEIFEQNVSARMSHLMQEYSCPHKIFREEKSVEIDFEGIYFITSITGRLASE